MIVENKNGLGNPNHDDATGQFTSSGGGGAKQSDTLSEEYQASKLMDVNIISSNSLSDVLKNVDKDRKLTTEMDEKEFEDMINSEMGKYSELVKLVKKNYSKVIPTFLNDTPERNALRENIVKSEFYRQDDGKKKFEKKLVLVLGSPASGKSTIQKKFEEKNGAFVVDADKFKEYLPEFRIDKNNVSACHQESVEMSKQFMRKVSQKGGNIVLSKVGGQGSADDIMENYLQPLIQNGYEVKIVYNDLPIQKCVRRSISRYEKEKAEGGNPRLITPEVFKTADGHILDTVNKLIQNKGVTGFGIYSNDVEPGQDPVLLHSSKDWEND